MRERDYSRGLTVLRAVIFDFDGLLLDTETAEYEEWSRIFNSLGAELTVQDWIGYVGTWVDASLLDLLEARTDAPFDRAELRERHASAVRAHIDRQDFCEGVRELVPSLRAASMRLAIASNSDLPWVRSHLDHRSYRGNFDHICTRDDGRPLKPEPDVYLLALERLGVSAAEAVAFEDSVAGATAAVAAGLRTFAVPNPITRLSDFPRPVTRLRSLADVTPAWLQAQVALAA